MRNGSQPDREFPRDPPDQDKQEAVEKLGLSPPSYQRLNSLISHLYFPDTGRHDGRYCPDFLVKLPPELLITNRHLQSCFKKGVPLVIWLYNQLNVEDSVWCSVKHDGPLCCINANSVGHTLKDSYTHSAHVSPVGDAEHHSTVTKGWHLHAFNPYACSAFLLVLHTLISTNTGQQHTSSTRFNHGV